LLEKEEATTVSTNQVVLYDSPEAKRKISDLVIARSQEEERIESLARAAEQAKMEQEKRKTAL